MKSGWTVGARGIQDACANPHLQLVARLHPVGVDHVRQVKAE